jgi:uncharacterized protein YhfF
MAGDMTVPSEFHPFWSAAQKADAAIDAARFYEAFAFGDSERMAEELARLVLAGTKRATASLVWTYEAESKPRPTSGDLSIVTTWSRTPLCIIETTAVDIVPFEDVTEDFAATEGEDGGTLQAWRRGHTAFFARECARIGRVPNPRMDVVCERFRVVYQRD